MQSVSGRNVHTRPKGTALSFSVTSPYSVPLLLSDVQHYIILTTMMLMLDVVAGMGGPEVAGELYKVFKAWLSQRILRGSSANADTAAVVSAAEHGARGDVPETAVPFPLNKSLHLATRLTERLALRRSRKQLRQRQWG